MDHWSSSRATRDDQVQSKTKLNLASYFHVKGSHFQNEFQREDRREDHVQIIQSFGIVLVLIVILNREDLRLKRECNISTSLSSPEQRCWSWSERRSRIQTEEKWQTTRSSVDSSSREYNVWSAWLSERIRCIYAAKRRKWSSQDRWWVYLILIQFTIAIFLFSFVLKRHDNETDEDVHHEEGNDLECAIICSLSSVNRRSYNDEGDEEWSDEGSIVVNWTMTFRFWIDCRVQ